MVRGINFNVHAWLNNEPWEETPRFYEARPCPKCRHIDTTFPKRASAPGTPGAIQARCMTCPHHGECKPTWREALADFYGPLRGRSPRSGIQVGQRFRVVECVPPVYPIGKLTAGDVVTLIDFETGAFTVRRDADQLEEVISVQNIGELIN